MSSRSAAELRVLLVEDDLGDTRKSIALLATLGRGGAGVEHVGSAEDALARLDQETPVDVVLLDLELPGLAGLDAVRALRERAPQVPLVVFTANDDADLALLAVAMGAQDVLLKGATDAVALARAIGFARQRQQILSRADWVRASRPSPLVPAAPEAPEGLARELAGLRVLMVDDSDESCALIAAYLAPSGAEVEVVDDARSALERLALATFDVVLMDLHLPGMDGFAATRELRRVEAERAAHPVPVIALSADTLPKTVERALACGCTEHLAKPIRRADLLAVLRGYVDREADRTVALGSARLSTATTLLPKFVGHRERDVGTLREAIARLDFDVISTLAHNMRGNGVSYGFPEISEIGRRLGKAASTEDVPSVVEEVTRLEACLQRIRKETGLAGPSPSRPSSSTRVRATTKPPLERKTGEE